MSENVRTAVRCPKCGSSKVRYSRKLTIWDSILDLLFSMEAFRCRSCRARFHKFDPGDEEEEEVIVESKDRPAEPPSAAPPASEPHPEGKEPRV